MDEEQTLIDQLKNADDVRVTSGNKWMYWNGLRHGWIVMQQKYRKHTREIGSFDDLRDALNILLNDD